MTIGICIITDGRGECFERTVQSLHEMWDGPGADQIVVINDSADPTYGRWLSRQFGYMEQVHHIERKGFGGAIRSAWAEVGHHDWIFHLEDDFTFNEPIEVDAMIDVLDTEIDVVQMALKRQPWSPEEKAVGGFMEQHPEAYTNELTHGHRWCWQRLFFTTNPSFYRGSLTKRGWPEEKHSEGMFSHRLMEDRPQAKFGFWGHTQDPPRVTHIGDERVGTGY